MISDDKEHDDFLNLILNVDVRHERSHLDCGICVSTRGAQEYQLAGKYSLRQLAGLLQ